MNREQLLSLSRRYSAAMQQWGFELAKFAVNNNEDNNKSLDIASSRASTAYLDLTRAIVDLDGGQPEWLNQALNEGDGTYKP